MNLKYNSEKMLELLKDFHTLTKFRLVIFDDKFNKIMAYPQESCDFCAMLKSNIAAKKKCADSDCQACLMCKKTGKLHIYQCHAGLFEVVTPLKLNDIIIGYIMFGQIAEKSKKKTDKERILRYCTEFCNDAATLERSYEKLISKTEKQIKSASKILETCACYLWITETVKIDGNNLFYRLSSYIESHIRDCLTVETLCREFGISRSRLYELSDRYFGMSIAKYIRKKRIEIAKKHLAENKSSIAEVADTAGFYDYNYFSKVFKAETGITPIKYRQSI